MKTRYETEDPREIFVLNEKVDRLRSIITAVMILLGVTILLLGAILYLQLTRVSNLSGAITQQSTRVDDLTMNVGNMTDISIGLATEIGNVKQDVSTVINMLRDAGPSANPADMSNASLKSPLHVQFSCVDETSNQIMEPCEIHVKILEVSPIDEFDLDSGQTLAVVPQKIRLSISVDVSGYMQYSNIFEYTDDGTMYPFLVQLKKQ